MSLSEIRMVRLVGAFVVSLFLSVAAMGQSVFADPADSANSVEVANVDPKSEAPAAKAPAQKVPAKETPAPPAPPAPPATEYDDGADVIDKLERFEEPTGGQWFKYYPRNKRRGPLAIPFHSLEGYSGGAITTVAWLCNPCHCDPKGITLPAVSASFADMNSKELYSMAVTQTFFNRVELGYGYVNFNMGSLHDDTRKLFEFIDSSLPIPVEHMRPCQKYIEMHNVNLRAQIIKENQWDCELVPAVSAGVHFKYNESIDKINKSLYEPVIEFDLADYGYKRNYGFDYTLAVSKKYRDPIFYRPVFNSVAYRLSQGSQLGLLGFGGAYRGSFEFNIGYMPFDFLLVGYEYRDKKDSYRTVPDVDAIPGATLPGLINGEDAFQAISLNMMLGRNGTLSVFWGILGTLANSEEDSAIGVQLKWEF